MLAVPRLLALQLTGFLLLEGAERVFVGLNPVHVLAEPAVLLGLILQLGAAHRGCPDSWFSSPQDTSATLYRTGAYIHQQCGSRLLPE